MNSHMLCNWLCITAIANYARGMRDNIQSSNTYFGPSISKATMNRVLENVRTENCDTSPQMLAKERIILATMDNNQKVFNVKNPIHGINNKFVKVTMRTFL